ncbi:5492_t:CDS:2 [Acaulospora morrowiae]|uniref:5492_t:CDS:1 n=1 Tax=Acaulospora morrowiae TaxID=94023 RepID=A0A9N9FZP8_9GLOM|nr:5492_t:CDS:2 [Acaulospora morrowiae]
MSINTLRAIATQLGEEPEHSLLQQYQDGTDLENIRIQEETDCNRVIGNNGQLKRTKSVSASDNSPYQSDTEQTDHKKRKVNWKDLDLALNTNSAKEACSFIELAKKKAKDRMTILRVANEYGWDVAVELPQSKYNDVEDDMEDGDYKRYNQTKRGNYYKARSFVNKNTFYNQKIEFYTKNLSS